jgi:hypothetical protein
MERVLAKVRADVSVEEFNRQNGFLYGELFGWEDDADLYEFGKYGGDEVRRRIFGRDVAPIIGITSIACESAFVLRIGGRVLETVDEVVEFYPEPRSLKTGNGFVRTNHIHDQLISLNPNPFISVYPNHPMAIENLPPHTRVRVTGYNALIMRGDGQMNWMLDWKKFGEP